MFRILRCLLYSLHVFRVTTPLRKKNSRHLRIKKPSLGFEIVPFSSPMKIVLAYF